MGAQTFPEAASILTAIDVIRELDFSELDEHAGVLDGDNTVAIREVALTTAEVESWDPDFSCEPEENA